MLMLSRKIEEGIKIGDTIEIKILDVFSTEENGGRKAKVASIGITAPREISILRKELLETKLENQAAQESARDISGGIAALLRQKKQLEQQGLRL